MEAIGRRIADLSAALPDVQLLVLFGSVAKGRARASSDLDIGMLCDGPIDFDTMYGIVASHLGTGRIDLVDLSRTGTTLSFAVARDGIPLIERPPGRFRTFQSLASRRYADAGKLREAQRRAILRFLERHRRP